MKHFPIPQMTFHCLAVRTVLLLLFAGAVFFLSERTRLAATAAAILPSALATASSVRLGARWVCLSRPPQTLPMTQICCFHRVQQGKETKEFQDLVKQMLSDMKIFKQLLRKSLNLIQGMEMMNQVLHTVYFQDINFPLQLHLGLHASSWWCWTQWWQW